MTQPTNEMSTSTSTSISTPTTTTTNPYASFTAPSPHMFSSRTCTRAHLDACQFHIWYTLFKKHTIQSQMIPLPDSFITYLQADGIVIPESVQQTQTYLNTDENIDDHEWTDSTVMDDVDASIAQAALDRLNGEQSEDEDEDEEMKGPFFPELMTQIQKAIDSLGGAVFPKLNWSSPRDASWITTERSPRVQHIHDLLLLLKSSDRVQQILDHAYDECMTSTSTQPSTSTSAQPSTSTSTSTQSSTSTTSTSTSTSTQSSTSPSPSRPSSLYLVLRKWSQLYPSREFRVFVRDQQIVGITQRDSTYYDHLANDTELLHDLKCSIFDFHSDHIQYHMSINHYVMDVYVDTSMRVWLVGIKPFSAKHTDGILFRWNELIPKERMTADAKEEEETEADTLVPTTTSTSPPDLSYGFEFRVVKNNMSGGLMDIPRQVQTMMSRLPVQDNIDVSDDVGIQRFVERVRHGDLKQH